MKKNLFSLFYVDNDCYIAVPVEIGDKYDKKMVYILGTIAIRMCKEFDLNR